MKIGIWLNDNIIPNTGGGFSYSERLIELIDKKEFQNSLEVVFLKCFDKETILQKNVIYLKTKKINKINFIHKVINKFSKRNPILKSINDYIIISKKKSNLKEIRRQLIIHNIDVIYYLTQQEQQVEDFPFISTNWDLGHLTMRAFPEVAAKGEFDRREKWYKEDLKKAIAIFADSEAGKEELIRELNIDQKRVFVLPIFAGKVINLEVTKAEEVKILKKHKLNSQKYFFYPAQFWEHKNHLNLLLAFKKFVSLNQDIKLVLTGSDKGNLNNIKSFVKNNALENSVIYPGFVELVEIHVLYRNAIALVMPTFLGPTNMPLLEARALGCPILCSDFKGHREQLADGALYFNPESFDEIYMSLIKIMDVESRQQILVKAKLEDEKSKFNGEKAIEILEQNLIKVDELRSNFKN